MTSDNQAPQPLPPIREQLGSVWQSHICLGRMQREVRHRSVRISWLVRRSRLRAKYSCMDYTIVLTVSKTTGLLPLACKGGIVKIYGNEEARDN